MESYTKIEGWKRREKKLGVEVAKLEQEYEQLSKMLSSPGGKKSLSQKLALKDKQQLTELLKSIQREKEDKEAEKVLLSRNIAKCEKEDPGHRPLLVMIMVTVILSSGLMIYYAEFMDNGSGSLTGAAVMGGSDNVMIQSKGHFKATENPKFTLSLGVTGGVGIAEIPINETVIQKELTQIYLVYPDQTEVLLEEKDIKKNEEINLTLPISRKTKPGQYKLKIKTPKGNDYLVTEQNFTWGVLAINTHKSIYLPGETAQIAIGVLDNAGNVVCNATVALEITAPSGSKEVLSTSNGRITISPLCPEYIPTSEPDYTGTYTVNELGVHAMNLTAVTYDGISNIDDSFSAQSYVEFDVARSGPTRIFPQTSYVMNFTLAANQNYSGEVKEVVPNSFVITSQEGMSTVANGDNLTLTWNKEFIAGQNYTFGYEFDAPDVSPYLYTLGPLQIGAFSEAREWMIVSDALGDTWWNPYWNNRREINLSNSESALTDFQVKVEFNATNVLGGWKWNWNGNDLRFATKNGTLLPHWIESWDASTQNATVWISVPTLAGNSNTTIYVYYNRPSASSTSNITATFLFGDDFDSVLDSTKWTATTGSPYTANGKLVLDASTGVFGGNYAIPTFTIWESYADPQSATRAGTPLRGATTSVIGFVNDGLLTTDMLWQNIGNVVAEWENGESVMGAYATGFKRYKITTYTGTPDKTIYDYNSGQLTYTRNNRQLTNLYPTIYSADGPMQVGFIFIRKYATSEPTVAAIGSEEQSAKAWDCPQFNKCTGNECVDLCQYNYDSIRNITNFKAEYGNKTKVHWLGNLNLSSARIGNDNNLDNDIYLGEEFVSIDSVNASAFAEEPANITFINISCGECNPNLIIYAQARYATADEVSASGGSCVLFGTCFNFTCSNPGGVGNCTFGVSGFSGFASGGNANLTINDSTENSNIEINLPLTYFAYYINASDGTAIIEASCNVSDSDSTTVMVWDASRTAYNYTKTAGFTSSGLKNWNVTCSKTGYTTLFANDTITITVTKPVLISPLDNGTTTNRTPSFTWNNSVGTTGPITYNFILDDNPTFNNPEINATGIINTTGTNTTYTVETELAVDTVYYWKVRGNDSAGYGIYSEVFNFTLQSYLAISLLRTAVNFGEVSSGINLNTSTGNPLPFLAENAGNIFANVTITATPYFSQAAFPSSAYQFRVEENESGAFNTTTSTMSWTNMNNISASPHVYNLDWHYIKNDFQAGININIPLSEPQGVKSSTVTFEVG